MVILAGGVESGVLPPPTALLLKSEDAGKTWTPVNNPFTSDIDKAQFLDSETGFVVVQERIHRTRDGGSTWIALTGLPEIRNFSFLPGGLGLAWKGASMMRTEDFGTNWTSTSLPLLEDIHHVQLMDRNNILVIAGAHQTFYSRDEGRTWVGARVDVPLSGNLSQGHGALYFHNNRLLFKLGYEKCLQDPPLSIRQNRVEPASNPIRTLLRGASGIRYLSKKGKAYDANGKTRK